MSDSGAVVLGDAFRAVLLDVAGTTTSLGFLKDTLLPFAVSNVEEFLKSKWEDDTVKDAVKALNGEKELDVEETVKTFKELTEAGSDNVGLKTLQGLIYEKGYESGDLKAHVFSDVSPALESWSKTLKVAVFSTGSVASQQLLFRNTLSGDLSSHISAYYDQQSGSKTEPGSYEKISENLGVNVEEVVFFTDSVEEAKAAKKAKMEAVLVMREGNEEVEKEAKETFKVVKGFEEVSFEAQGKRKSEDPIEEEQRPAKVAKTEETVIEIVEKTTEAPAEAMEEETITAEPESTTEDVEKKEVQGRNETDKAAESVEETEQEGLTEKEPIEVTPTEIEKEKPAQPGQTDAKTENAEETKPAETEVLTEPDKLEEPSKAEEAVSSESKEEENSEKEKESTSDLANGTNETEQNGDLNGEDKKEESEETEIKVKKLEEAGETTSVSVEA